MKSIFLLIFFQLITINPLKSQTQEKLDKIIYKDKTSKECKVLKVTDNSIEIDPVGSIPFLIIERNKVEYIIYADNTVVNLQTVPISSESQNQISSLDKTQVTNDMSWKNCQTGIVFSAPIPYIPYGKGEREYTEGVIRSKNIYSNKASFFEDDIKDIKSCYTIDSLTVSYHIKFSFDEYMAISPVGSKYLIYDLHLTLLVYNSESSKVVYNIDKLFTDQIILRDKQTGGVDFNVGLFEYKGQPFKVLLRFSKLLYWGGKGTFYHYFWVQTGIFTEGWDGFKTIL